MAIDAILEKLERQTDARGIEKAVLTVSIADALVGLKQRLIERQQKESNQNGSAGKSVSP
jgi:hypothetical protein